MENQTEASAHQEPALYNDKENTPYPISYSFISPFLGLNYKDEFMNVENSKSHYTQGCKWAPDGLCFVVASDDRQIKIFNLPENVMKGEFSDENWIVEGWKEDIKPAVSLCESENIYDYQWYPFMQSSDRSTCCFAVTCRDLPIHLWDSWTGQLICSYLYFDHLEQLLPAHSLSFSQDGSKLVGGYAKKIQVFDVERHGRCSSAIAPYGPSGIVSTIAFHPHLPSIFAAGSYNSSIGLYSLNNAKAFAVFKGHTKGVTHLRFTKDGTKLLSGTRKDDEIICWDIRNPGNVLAVFKRTLTTNQRMYFDVTPTDQYLISGTTEGNVLVWDMNECLGTKSLDKETLPTHSFAAHDDCVNGVSVHPFAPILITSCGQRIVSSDFECEENSDDSESDTQAKDEHKKATKRENSVKLWWIGEDVN